MGDLTEKKLSTSTKIVGCEEDSSESYYQKVDSHGSSHIAIMGNDGLYKAFVDSEGRLSVNANITFPEAEYQTSFVQNGTNRNLNVNGSSTNVSYKYTPTTNVYYVEEITIVIVANTSQDLTQFGSLVALTNGLQINSRSKGNVKNIATIKDNRDLVLTFGEDKTYLERSGGLGGIVYSERTATMKIQQRITLDPSTGDYLEVLVRDNLAGLTILSVGVRAWKLLG